MKEFILRAWDEGKKVMHYNYKFISTGTAGNDWVVFTSDKQSNYTEAVQNPYFAQQLKQSQFTGMTDLNGGAVFTGDIFYIDGLPYVVFFNESTFCFDAMAESGEVDPLADFAGRVRVANSNNIFEHPELLPASHPIFKKPESEAK